MASMFVESILHCSVIGEAGIIKLLTDKE